jgi:opacity protein-like surface antigen
MKNFLIVCAGAALLASSVFAADAREDAMEAAAFKAAKAAALNAKSGSVIAVPTPGMAVTPASGTPPVIGNFILVGADELGNGIPCYYCAPSPNGGYGVALTIPMGYIPSTVTSIDYSFMFQDVTENGVCVLAFAAMQGTTVLDSAGFSYPIYPSVWVVTFPRTTPTVSGPISAFGYVICNGVQQTLIKTTVILQ